MNVLKNICVLAFLMALPTLLAAQPGKKLLDKIEAKKQVAVENATSLRKGVLVVQLKTFRNKIGALRKMKPTKRNKKYLQDVIQERDTLALATIAAYKENYSYSTVYFMPDTMAKKLFSGQTSGIFVNEELEIDESIDLGKLKFFMAYVGMPPMSRSSGKISLLIVDSNNELLPKPFPYATKFYGFFQTILGTSEAEAMPKAVKLLDKRLSDYIGDADE